MDNPVQLPAKWIMNITNTTKGSAELLKATSLLKTINCMPISHTSSLAQRPFTR